MKFGMAVGLLACAALHGLIFAQEPLPTRPVRVALLGFPPQVAEMSIAELSNDPNLQFVERAELERLLSEVALSLSQNLKGSDAIRAGKMLGADWLLLGQSLSVHGTNHLLARIVDARNGIIRDLTVFAAPSNTTATAQAVAAFLRSSYGRVRALSERKFIAVGAFTDLSINRRYPDFGDQFRAWLTERFKTSAVAVVERSATETLLNELRLSQGGLSEARTNYTEAAPAFLIADGIYQSFQDTNSKLNIVLRLQRVGERARAVAFNEPPGGALNTKLVEAIEKELAANPTRLATDMRKAEVAEQIRRGRDLGRIVYPERPHLNRSVPYEQLRETRSRELLDAIAAFRAALFLDPDHTDAKYFLGLCLVDAYINQKEEARNFFREVVAASTNTAFVKGARECIAESYVGEDDEHAYELYSAMSQESANGSYSQQLAMIQRALLKAGRLPLERHLELQTAAWRATCRAEETKAASGETVDFGAAFISPIHEYSAILTSLPRAERYRRLRAHVADFLPKLKAEFPRFEHHFTLGYFDTFGGLVYLKPPTWLVRDFDEMLSWCEARGQEIASPKSFYPVLARKVPTFVGTSNAVMAVRIASIVNKYGRSHLTRRELDKNDVLEGFAHRELGNWAEAVTAFQRVGDREISLAGDGPWGKNKVVNAAIYAKECQRRLTGEAEVEIPTFNLGKPLFTLAEPQSGGDSEGYPINPTNILLRSTNVFATLLYVCDGMDIWAAHGKALHRYNLNSGRLERVPLSITNGSIIRALAVDKGKVWIGTRTNGLIVADPATGACRNFTEADGLILPSVTAIFPAADRVWLGFASDGTVFAGGGLGYLPRGTEKFVAFSRELSAKRLETDNRSRDGPNMFRSGGLARMPIYEIRGSASNSVMVAGGGIWRFWPDNKKWERVYSEESLSCMDGNAQYLVTGSYEPSSWSGDNPRFGGIAIRRMTDDKWHVVSRKDGLPNADIRSVALDGNKLWVGGRDFIALIELPSMSIARMLQQLPNKQTARALQIHDGHVFTKIGSTIYRFPSQL